MNRTHDSEETMREAFDDQREWNRKRRDRNEEKNTAVLCELEEQHGLKLTEVTCWQIRVTNPKQKPDEKQIIIDIYPKSNKYHRIHNNTRGNFFHDLRGFIIREFGIIKVD